MSKTNIDQYIWQNNIEIQGIPASVSNDSLKDEVIDIFKLVNIRTDKENIEIARLGKSESKNAIVKFVSKKICRQMLGKMFDLPKMVFSSAGLGSNTKVFVNESLSPCNKKYHARTWC